MMDGYACSAIRGLRFTFSKFSPRRISSSPTCTTVRGRFILRPAWAWRRHAYHAAMLSLPFAFCGRVPCLAMEEGDGVSDALPPSQPFQLVYVRRVPKQLLKAP